MKPRRPSQLQRVARCEVRWLCSDDEETPAMRFGTAVHAVLESFYKGAKDPPRAAADALDALSIAEGKPGNPCVSSLRGAGWRSPAGRCAMAGMSYLPRPDRCKQIFSEAPAIIPGEVPVAGTRDLLTELYESEQDRLGIAEPWLVVDYKTSSNPLAYAKTPAILRNDAQGIVYPYSAILDQGLDRISCRWLYLPSRAPHVGARPIDFVQRRTRLEIVGVPQVQARARRILTILQDPAQATRNPEACNDYNKLCPLHVRKGGFCDPRKEQIDMGKLLAKAKALRAEEPELDETEEETEEVEEASPPKATKARSAAKATKPAPEKDPEPVPDAEATAFEATINAAFHADEGRREVRLDVSERTVIPVGARVRVEVIG